MVPMILAMGPSDRGEDLRQRTFPRPIYRSQRMGRAARR